MTLTEMNLLTTYQNHQTMLLSLLNLRTFINFTRIRRLRIHEFYTMFSLTTVICRARKNYMQGNKSIFDIIINIMVYLYVSLYLNYIIISETKFTNKFSCNFYNFQIILSDRKLYYNVYQLYIFYRSIAYLYYNVYQLYIFYR